MKIKSNWQGFVPMFIPFLQALCAFYHCKSERWEGRRYCKKHAGQYDREALAGDSKLLRFTGSASGSTPS